jgi:hypothetical protein
VKRRQGVCGPEQACEREIIAPKSIVVEEANLVPQKGRPYRHKRDRVSVCGRFRGSDPQHADKGTFVDWGDPTVSDAAHQLERSRGDQRVPRQSLVTSRRKSDGARVLGAWESHVHGEGVRSACTGNGKHGPSAAGEYMLDTEPGRQSTVATELDRITAKARREPKLTCTS